MASMPPAPVRNPPNPAAPLPERVSDTVAPLPRPLTPLVGREAAADGQPERAVRLLGAADAVLEALGVAVSFNHEQQRRAMAAARAALPEAAYAAAWAAGRALTPDGVIAESIAVAVPSTRLATAALRDGLVEDETAPR